MVIFMEQLHLSLEEALSHRKVIPLVGAGLSMSIKNKDGERVFPSWSELLEKAADRIELENDENNATLVRTFLKINDYQQAAKYAHDGLRGGLWKSFLDKQFDLDLNTLDESSAELPKIIWKISNKVITLNYDRILHHFHPNIAQVLILKNTAQSNLIDILDDENKAILWHLHGHIDDVAELILTPESYLKLYSTNIETKNKYEAALEILKSVIRQKSLLFIGCSLDDAELIAQINKQQNLFNDTTSTHYALIRKADKRAIEEKLKDTHIKLITFDDFGQPLLDKLKQISDLVNVTEENKEIEKEDIKIEKKAEVIKAAFLSANPLGENQEYCHLINEFKKTNLNIDYYPLTINSLNNLSGYTYIFISSKIIKNKLIIEDEHLGLDKITFSDLDDNIDSNGVDGLFIFTNLQPSDECFEKTELPIVLLPILGDNKFKKTLNQFYFKIFKKSDMSFLYDIGCVYNESKLKLTHSVNKKGTFKKITTDLPRLIDRKSVEIFIGRKEDLNIVSQKISKLERDNGFLTIKGTGGLGKTALIKKIAVEYSERGKYEEGISFIDCEFIENSEQFKYKIATVFNLEQAKDVEYNIKKHVKNMDRLIILDNFETLLYIDDKDDVLSFLSFICEYAAIVITSREFLNIDGEIEYTLRQMTTDEAFELFMTKIKYDKYNEDDIKLIREDVVDRILDKNPLAIKIITACILPSKNIKVLVRELEDDLFNITNQDLDIFDNEFDFNIDRKKSLYGSIFYSYKMLNDLEAKAFEKLSLFPDGIDVENFKKICSKDKLNKNIISDRVLKSLQNKSLVETNKGYIKLQSIVSRFAEHMLNQREDKNEFLKSACEYNMFIMDHLISSLHFAEYNDRVIFDSAFSTQQNNIFKSILYINIDEVDPSDLCSLLQTCKLFCVRLSNFNTFILTLKKISPSSDNNINLFIKSLIINLSYYHGDFENSIIKMNRLFSIEYFESFNLNCQKKCIRRHIFENFISLYEMEGNEYSSLLYDVKFNRCRGKTLDGYPASLYHIGILSSEILKNLSNPSISSLEVKSALNELSIEEINDYISGIPENYHLARCHAMYIRSKLEPYNKDEIDSIVIVNPFTLGMKCLISALSESNTKNANDFYINAISALYHIKYFHVEAIYYYAKFLLDNNLSDFDEVFDNGYILSKKHKYCYVQYLFEKLIGVKNKEYNINDYSFPNLNIPAIIKQAMKRIE